MKGKIVMTIYSVKEVSYPEKLKFMKKILGNYDDPERDCKTNSFVHKFNNSYGYKDVQNTYDGATVISPKIATPDNYHSPEYLLLTGATFTNKKNELMSFIVPGRRMLHPNRKFSYEPIEMLFNFEKFLYKVFPDIRIQFEIKDENFKLSLRDFALGHFMTCFSFCENCETEFSAPALLKKKEQDYILNIVSKVISFKPEITQFWCKTCYGYHKDLPYHIQIDKVREN